VERDFPDDFLWSSSTAAHQVEGGNVNNDWWAWEHTPCSTAIEPSGDAIDHYHRYAQDFGLLAGLGHNAHRFSLEWSRIQPERGEWSRSAVDHYLRVLDTLAGVGLAAFTTLYHFTVPRWFADRGGWAAPDAPDAFADYVERIAPHLRDRTPYVCTVNEPQIVALFGYLLGYHPPGLRNPHLWHRVTRNLIRAHEAAVEIFAGGPRTGVCLQMPDLQPARPGDPACLAATEELEREMIEVYLQDLRGDYVGVQYYTRMRVDPAHPDYFAPAAPGVPVTQMGWEFHPDGLRKTLHKAARAGKPIVITENGVATADDAERVDYLDSHLAAVLEARREGVDVRGYTYYWSAFDNFAWAEGYRPLFGLVGIDRSDGLARQVRPSAHAYARVARTGRLTALRETD
jgi:beta-glucosidase